MDDSTDDSKPKRKKQVEFVQLTPLNTSSVQLRTFIAGLDTKGRVWLMEAPHNKWFLSDMPYDEVEEIGF